MISNNLLNLLHESGIKARYDTEVKKFLSNKTILSWILKFTVKEFQNCTIEEIWMHQNTRITLLQNIR